jgi:uncharacterized protein (TIGR03503 family)
MPIFLRAFDQSIASDQVPLEGNTFSIDASIKEFTVLIFRKPGSSSSKLKTPSGSVISKDEPGLTKWYTDTLYDLITVTAPDVGDWILDADLDPDNRVTIVSDMELNLRGLPNNIIQGQKVALDFFLADNTGPIREASLLALLDIDFEQIILSQPPKVLRAKVTSHTQGKVRTPEDGIYSAKLSKTLVNGEHQFTVSVDGKTFKREQTKRARVFAQVMEPTVVNQTTQDNSVQYFVNLVPIKGLVDAKSLEISGNIKKPSGVIEPVEAIATQFGSWTIAVPPVEGKKIYKAFVTIKGVTTGGDEFSLTQGPISVDYSKPLGEMQQPAQDLFDQIGDMGSEEEQKELKETKKVIAKAAQEEMSSTQPMNSDSEETEEQLDEESDENESTDEYEEELDTDDDSESNDINDIEVDESIGKEPDSNVPNEDSESPSDASTLLYIGIGLGNIILIGGLIFFIRRWMKKKKAAAELEDQELLEEVEKAKNQATKKVENKTKKVPDTTAAEPVDDTLAAEANKISDMLDNLTDPDETNNQ